MNRTTYTSTRGLQEQFYNRRKLWITGVILLIILLLLSAVFITKTVTAKSDRARVKLVTSIEIKSGDSLWSIASEYLSEDYADINAFIKEIKATNRLSSDEIHAGNYIVVPYYEDQTRAEIY